jgi:hypothetical protein
MQELESVTSNFTMSSMMTGILPPCLLLFQVVVGNEFVQEFAVEVFATSLFRVFSLRCIHFSSN